MLFKSKPVRLAARHKRIEDEILGYLITRKEPPAKLVEMASKMKLELELMGRRPGT
jgi:hypothetical protein